MQAGQRLGPYAIEKELGYGAMGTVYLARDTEADQPVAIKIITGGHESNPTSVDRFKRETKILKKLNHPNIVRLHTSGRIKGGGPFYVMEYIDGESLEKALKRRGRFTWEEVVTLGSQVCAALQHAHEQGIVHRDLKPANVMMTADGVAKLTDFGIAKGLELTQLTATNCTVGTASYMSPEQCRGEKNLTYKSDLYSLGVVFYELLTGRLPFLAETPLDMFLAHTEGKFERPSRLVLDIPIWLDTLVCQLLEKEPGKRPLDAAMVARALSEIAEKVVAQRSAGVDMVSARKIDLPRGARLRDEADREAARALVEATTKKKIKRRTRPFYERGWFQVVGISAFLLGLGAFTWLSFFRPPSPDDLHHKARVLMEAHDAGGARDGPIKRFLELYPDRTDPQAVEMHAWADKFDLELRERQLHNKMKVSMTPEGEAEPVAYGAVRAEEIGDLALAGERWQALEKYQNDPDPELRPWGLLAAKRLREIKEADDLDKGLLAQLLKLRTQGKEMPADPNAESRALWAIYAEMFGDPSLALDGWQKLKDTLHGDPNQRVRALLAARKVHDLKPKAPQGPNELKFRKELIETALIRAGKLKGEKPVEAKFLCRDVIALYGRDPAMELAEQVARARTLLAEIDRK